MKKHKGDLTAKPGVVYEFEEITGACASGVEHFLSGKKYGAKVTVAHTIEETVGQYGHAQFAGFFKAAPQ